MHPAAFDELERVLGDAGPNRAIEQLCERLRAEKDYGGLFYAMLLRKRYELGLSPIPTGPSSDIPEEHHAAYEDAIREAGRLVGNLYLQEKNIPLAWSYFRMIGEPEPVRAALEAHEPGTEDDLQPLVQIALYEGVHPRKGYEWVLSRYGLCNAITTISSLDPNAHAPADREHCIRMLVRALYQELRERLLADVERREGRAAEADLPPDTPGVVRKLIATRPALFEDDFYHIDVSHLSSVVQLSVNLTPGLELDLARELCEYGQKLSPRFQNPGEPPFENQYEAFGHYLSVLAGDKVEEGLAYFRQQVEATDPQEYGTYCAEVLINLLLKANRPAEALAVARKYLAYADGRQISCPSISELCQKVRDFRTLAEVAREQNDPVHFLAGLLASKA